MNFISEAKGPFATYPSSQLLFEQNLVLKELSGKLEFACRPTFCSVDFRGLLSHLALLCRHLTDY
jgi:hypothetical protein